MRRWYERTFHFNQVLRDEWITERAKEIPAGARVLDVGAGEGRYGPLFSHCEYRTQDFGLEPATLGKYVRLDYQSDILEIPVPDGSFDVIICTEVLEHVPEPVRALREFARILPSGGKLLLTAPLGSFLHQEPYHFYGGYTPYWYKRFLPEVGFEILRLEPNGRFFHFVGQETQRFSSLLDPRRSFRLGAVRGLAMTLLWVVTLPVTKVIVPLAATPLDRLGLENIATVGYHVSAVRR